MYYRYLLSGIPSTTLKTPIESKQFTIIMMDEQFNYLSETKEDDDHLIFSLFTIHPSKIAFSLCLP
ncbi:MAG: hypothetical protein RR382_07880 [Tannerellaceae bacterium]